MPLPISIDTRDAYGDAVRPHIVFFGESVPMMDEAITITEQADVFVVIGTSLNVYPAASLLHFVPAGVPIYIIDPKPVRPPYDVEVEYIVKGAVEGVKDLVCKLLE